MIYVFLADGFEQMEALVPVDILRRAKMQVKTVSITGKNEAVSTLGVTVKTDITADEMVLDEQLEAVILPGGMPGAANLDGCLLVKEALEFADKKGAVIAAICAAPMVLGHAGLLKGKRGVCYPGFEKELYGAEAADCGVCTDGRTVTARGAGVSLEFALAVTTLLCGEEKAKKIAEDIQCRV